MSRCSFNKFKNAAKSDDFLVNAHAEAAIFVLNRGQKIKVVVNSEVSTIFGLLLWRRIQALCENLCEKRWTSGGSLF